MSLNRTEKAAVIDEVKAQVVAAQTLVLAEYRGTKVAEMTKLRKSAREQGVYLHVLKNTLARRAVAGTPFEVAAGEMSGPLIYGFSVDAIAAAKVVSEFAKTNDKLEIVGGAMGATVLDVDGVKAGVLGDGLVQINLGGAEFQHIAQDRDAATAAHAACSSSTPWASRSSDDGPAVGKAIQVRSCGAHSGGMVKVIGSLVARSVGSPATLALHP